MAGRMAGRHCGSSPQRPRSAWHGRSRSGTAVLGTAVQGGARDVGRMACISVRARDAHAWLGGARHGAVRRRAARQGVRGGRVDHIRVRVSDAHASRGEVSQGPARHGAAGSGMEGGRMVAPGVRLPGRPREARQGWARRGAARQGAAPHGKARKGERVEHTGVRVSGAHARSGWAWQCFARFGTARSGLAGSGEVRSGVAGQGQHRVVGIHWRSRRQHPRMARCG